MNPKACLCIFLFLISFQQKAQNSSKTNFNDQLKVNVLQDRSVQIEFTADENISNVLVLLVDNSGNTIFLENHNNFKGIYKRTVDLSKSAKGDYYLKITNDDETVNRKLKFE